ncbi:cytochrome c (plasmid) [Leisingera sp. M527]|uniref:cytochrome c n=1 Tax=Leisingera sp. M527 TaxID=2867014 RepID=UPI0021A55BD0|nr:cytochrome c [Leisingera sp. M527]UWQ35349.1 cytochrome c [Leisingera sp. M527]
MLMRLAATLALAAGPAWAQSHGVEEGRDLFLFFCAECHGKGAASQGPMAEMMALQPPDLRQLAARNGGAFPIEAVAKQIDGRQPVAAHGDMPVFGPSLDEDQYVALALPSGQPMMVPRPLSNLINYLQSVQNHPTDTD